MTENNSTKPKQPSSIKDDITIPDDKTRLEEIIRQAKGINPSEHNNEKFKAPQIPRNTDNHRKPDALPNPDKQGARD